mgnify:CR=1 FL=1
MRGEGVVGRAGYVHCDGGGAAPGKCLLREAGPTVQADLRGRAGVWACGRVVLGLRAGAGRVGVGVRECVGAWGVFVGVRGPGVPGPWRASMGCGWLEASGDTRPR